VNDSLSQTDHPSDLGLGHQFVQLSSALTTSQDALDPDRVVSLTVHAVVGAERGGLTLLRATRAPLSVATTDELSPELDRLQYTCGEGPFFEPATQHGVVLADDLELDERWPRFGRGARELGVRSLLCLRLALGGADRAALVLYAGRPGVFDEAAVTSASLLAPFAALAAEAHLRAHDVGNLTAALATSRQIGTAVGIVMARHRVSSDEAFALLRKASMDLNRKVHDIASEVELIGDLPRQGPVAAGGDGSGLPGA
jgi:hypothetical protein